MEIEDYWVPSKEDYDEWRRHRVTQWAFRSLKEISDDYALATGEGATYDERSIESTALQTARAVGYVEGVRALQELKIKKSKDEK